MNQRSRALLALVASVVLLLGSGVAFALARSSGVGEQLAREPSPSPVVTDVAAPTPEADTATPEPEPAPSAPSSPAETDQPTVEESPVRVTDETTRTDATQIVIPEEPVSPRSIAIGSIGLSLPVTATGVSDDGQMEIPEDVAEMGWYKFGASPGDDVGSAVIAGHVDSFEYGVGPLMRLPQVSVGDEVIVESGDGQPLRYEVVQATRYIKADLPTDEIFAPDVPHQLVVITCGGRYVGGTTGYEDNIVVVARPMGA